MSVFLFILAALTFLIGIITLAISEIAALLLFLITAVLFSSAAIIDSINKLRKGSESIKPVKKTTSASPLENLLKIIDIHYNKIARISMISALILIPVGLIIAIYFEYSSNQNYTPISVKSRPTQTIKTAKATFTIPGNAYIDTQGKTVNILGDVISQEVVCQLKNGTIVAITRVQHSKTKGQYYFRILTINCTGWVSESFLKPE